MSAKNFALTLFSQFFLFPVKEDTYVKQVLKAGGNGTQTIKGLLQFYMVIFGSKVDFVPTTSGRNWWTI